MLVCHISFRGFCKSIEKCHFPVATEYLHVNVFRWDSYQTWKVYGRFNYAQWSYINFRFHYTTLAFPVPPQPCPSTKMYNLDDAVSSSRLYMLFLVMFEADLFIQQGGVHHSLKNWISCCLHGALWLSQDIDRYMCSGQDSNQMYETWCSFNHTEWIYSNVLFPGEQLIFADPPQPTAGPPQTTKTEALITFNWSG